MCIRDRAESRLVQLTEGSNLFRQGSPSIRLRAKAAATLPTEDAERIDFFRSQVYVEALGNNPSLAKFNSIVNGETPVQRLFKS